MKYLILILAFITTSVFANTISAPAPSLTVNDRVFVGAELDNLVPIQCTTLTGFTTCTKSGSAYTAAGASGFRIVAVQIGANGSAADICGMGYDDVIRINVGGSPPAPLVEFGIGPTGQLNNRFMHAPVAPNKYTYYFGNTGPVVPNGKYPWLVCGSAGSYKTAIYYGVEE